MDNPKYIQCLSEITQANIELESMKAANLAREQQGHSPAFGEEQFLTLKDNLYNRTIELLYH